MKLLRLVFPFALLLTGCSSLPPEPKEGPAAAEPVTGLHALYQLFGASHGWAPDAQIYELTSIAVSSVKPQPGKSAAWQVTFVSPSLQQSRTYTFSAVEASMSLHQGINSGKPEAWSRPPNASMKPFVIAAAKVDSDAAYQTALTKAKDFVSQHPDMPVIYQLSETSPLPNAAWRVFWGESPSTSPFSVLVDATTGAYEETLH